MWPRKRFDIGLRDIAVGMALCLKGVSRQTARQRLEHYWAPEGDGLAFLSVRSGFDALWQAFDLPQGTEVLITAVNIPHMAEIIRRHGLVPVPIDLDLATMAPQDQALAAALSPRTRALVVAHLFGGRVPIEPVITWARKHGLLVIEDCAQAFSGREYRGHPEADVSMFSFGSIKTATALGGALFRVKDRGLLEKMRSVEAQWPVQSRLRYLRTLTKYAWFSFMCRPIPFGAFVAGCRLCGVDYDRIIHSAVRGFPGDDWLVKIRHQPSGPLLALLHRRLRLYSYERIERRARKGEMLLSLLGSRVFCPGYQALERTHWVFPILVDDPVAITNHLQHAGFDAARTHSMFVIDPPPGYAHVSVAESRRLLAGLVCLPIYPEIPDRALRRMADVVLGNYRPRPVLVANTHPVG